MPPSVPTRPAAAANIDDVWGQWVHDWFKKRDLVRGSGNITLSTAYADITGMTMTLGAGWFMIMGIVDFSVGSAGVGDCTAVLDVDGVDQAGVVEWAPASGATGQGSVAQIWLVNIAGAGVIKLQAKKSIAAGTATAVGTNSALVVL